MTPEVISAQLPLSLPPIETFVARRSKASPFLKWAGGKKQLLPELGNYVPETYRRYIEPFVGAGALFFSLRPHNAVLGDLNEEMIHAYKAVQNNIDAFLAEDNE